jgi:hypothetical protein
MQLHNNNNRSPYFKPQTNRTYGSYRLFIILLLLLSSSLVIITTPPSSLLILECNIKLLLLLPLTIIIPSTNHISLSSNMNFVLYLGSTLLLTTTEATTANNIPPYLFTFHTPTSSPTHKKDAHRSSSSSSANDDNNNNDDDACTLALTAFPNQESNWCRIVLVDVDVFGNSSMAVPPLSSETPTNSNTANDNNLPIILLQSFDFNVKTGAISSSNLKTSTSDDDPFDIAYIFQHENNAFKNAIFITDPDGMGVHGMIPTLKDKLLLNPCDKSSNSYSILGSRCHVLISQSANQMSILETIESSDSIQPEEKNPGHLRHRRNLSYNKEEYENAVDNTNNNNNQQDVNSATTTDTDNNNNQEDLHGDLHCDNGLLTGSDSSFCCPGPPACSQCYDTTFTTCPTNTPPICCASRTTRTCQIFGAPCLMIVTQSVTVAYTTAAKQATSNIDAVVRLAIAETNAGYVASKVPIRLVLKIAYESSLPENYDSYLMLMAFKETDRMGANYAVMLSRDLSSCGRGFLDCARYDSSTCAFAVVKLSCATGYYSFGHEIGHIQGADHNVEVYTVPGRFPDNHGYIIQSGYQYEGGSRTIMAYSVVDELRLNVWSSPNLMVPVTLSANSKPKLLPCGVVGSSNNAWVITETRYDVAAFNTPLEGVDPPTPKPTVVGATWRPSRGPTTLKPTSPKPTRQPTTRPSRNPTTFKPSRNPTTIKPTLQPTTLAPTRKPSRLPTTNKPSSNPVEMTLLPSRNPTIKPTIKPTSITMTPSKQPREVTFTPTTKKPTFITTKSPTPPTKSPSTQKPSSHPSEFTLVPTTSTPTTLFPSLAPTSYPTEETDVPTTSTTSIVTSRPTPTHIRTSKPSLTPTLMSPSIQPTANVPSALPTIYFSPTRLPTRRTRADELPGGPDFVMNNSTKNGSNSTTAAQDDSSQQSGISGTTITAMGIPFGLTLAALGVAGFFIRRRRGEPLVIGGNNVGERMNGGQPGNNNNNNTPPRPTTPTTTLGVYLDPTAGTSPIADVAGEDEIVIGGTTHPQLQQQSTTATPNAATIGLKPGETVNDVENPSLPIHRRPASTIAAHTAALSPMGGQLISRIPSTNNVLIGKKLSWNENTNKDRGESDEKYNSGKSSLSSSSGKLLSSGRLKIALPPSPTPLPQQPPPPPGLNINVTFDDDVIPSRPPGL